MNHAVRLPAAVNTSVAAPHLSRHYQVIDTRAVIDIMAAEGFHVASAANASPRKTPGMFARHTIDFRRADAIEIGGATPRMLWLNSHDGTSTARLVGGFFRFACSNGLVVGHKAGQLTQRHTGKNLADNVIERVRQLAKDTERQYKQIEEWSRKELTPSQRAEYAQLIAQLRWGDANAYEADQIFRTRRAEDDAGDLWSLFNRAQENTMRGGLEGTSRAGRRLMSRPVTDLVRDIDYNSTLWTLTEDVFQAA